MKGERVGLLLMNSAEFMEAYFALAKVGAVVVPLNWRLVPDELEFILKDSGTVRLIFGDEFLDTVTELKIRGDRTDVAQWLQVGEGVTTGFAASYSTFRDRGSDQEPVRSRDVPGVHAALRGAGNRHSAGVRAH